MPTLWDLYDASTDAIERTVSRLVERDGAAGARMMGGGFGGHVLALLAADARIPMTRLWSRHRPERAC